MTGKRESGGSFFFFLGFMILTGHEEGAGKPGHEEGAGKPENTKSSQSHTRGAFSL